jgi:2,3-bisphosphoglycerate-independent phosphoglycerate mutase
MERSHQLLKNHPLNAKRCSKGMIPANSFWVWGAGTKPQLPSFMDKTGKRGIVVSAVDLLKGIGVAAGMTVAKVPGANATIDTNYAGKVDAACVALLEDGHDFAFIHIEAPDEASHKGDMKEKIRAIEYVDEKVVAPVYQRMCNSGEDFRLVVMTDHPTPLRLRTHTTDPVPYMIYDSTTKQENPSSTRFSEQDCSSSGEFIDDGCTFIDELFKR